MNKKEIFKKILEIQIFNLEEFNKDNTSHEDIFYYLSELASELSLIKYRDICLELVLYCKGAETGDLSYKDKGEILDYLNKEADLE